MKLLYINEFLNSDSGARVHGLELIKALKQHNISVLTIPLVKEGKFSNSSIKFNNILAPGLYDSLVLFKKIPRALLWLIKSLIAIQKEKPNCILIRPGLYDLFPIWLAKLTKLHIILEINASLYQERVNFYKMLGRKGNVNKLFSYIEIACLRNSSGIYAVSNVLKDIIQTELGDFSIPIAIIPNGVDITDFSVPDKEHHDSDVINICFVGSFHPWHGVGTLIDAFSLVCRDRKQIKLTIVGDGASREAAQQKVLQEGHQDKIIFTGRLSHEEVIKTIKKMDILVAPYHGIEKFYFSPLKIFEYMASQKAIVASNTGQISEILENEKDSLLIEPGKVHELYIALLRLIDSKELRLKLGANVFKKVNNYSWRNSAKQLICFIEQVIKSPRKESHHCINNGNPKYK